MGRKGEGRVEIGRRKGGEKTISQFVTTFRRGATQGEGRGKERGRGRDQSICITPADSAICFLCTFLLSQMEEECLGMYMTSDASTLKRSSRAGVQQQPAALPQAPHR